MRRPVIYAKHIVNYINNVNNVNNINNNNVMKLQICNNNITIDAYFKILGYGTTIVSNKISPFKSQSQIKIINNHDIDKYMKLPPADLKFSILLEDAINDIIKDTV